MGTFITRSQLHRYGHGFAIANDYVGVKQAYATASANAEAQTTVFLSHSHKDRELISSAVAFLRSHDVKLYVDWMDEGMPDVISAGTANALKARIQQQKKFLLMVTENSKDSRWVPWELGYADPVKGAEHIAMLPVSEGEDFVQNEYMKIYPKIRYVNETWWVWREDPKELVQLPLWLRR